MWLTISLVFWAIAVYGLVEMAGGGARRAPERTAKNVIDLDEVRRNRVR